jgi:hypothetical protein
VTDEERVELQRHGRVYLREAESLDSLVIAIHAMGYRLEEVTITPVPGRCVLVEVQR